MTKGASSPALSLVVRNGAGMTDDERTDDEIPDGYVVYHPSWQDPWDEDPTEGRRGFPIVQSLLVALIGASLGVVVQAFGLESMFWDVMRSLGL